MPRVAQQRTVRRPCLILVLVVSVPFASWGFRSRTAHRMVVDHQTLVSPTFSDRNATASMLPGNSIRVSSRLLWMKAPRLSTGKQGNQCFLSSSSQQPPKSSSRSLAWQIGTVAVAGGVYLAASSYFSGDAWRYNQDGEQSKEGVVAPPQAQVTSKVYFDISIDNQPTGRIVFGLHGHVVPKTAANFENLCRGHTLNNKVLSYEGSRMHRIIPGFMVRIMTPVLLGRSQLISFVQV